MSFISYAQNYEDVMLWRALKNIKNGFYIDVGAAWPDEDSVTKAFYDRGWRGINIEPNPSHYASLETKRQGDTNLKVAVGDKADTLTMNFLGETGLSTLVEEIAKQHQASGWEISQKTVSVQTLQSICNSYIPAGQIIHFLKVDVEGFEAEVLRSHDWIKYRPWIVLVEATSPMTQHESYEAWEPILKKADYVFAYADGLNRFYVCQEKATDFLKVLQYPPNVFDGYIRIEQHEAEQRSQQALEDTLAIQTQADQLSQQLALAQSQEQQAKGQLQQALCLAQTAQAQADQLIQQLALAQNQEQQTKEQLQHALSLALDMQSQGIEQARHFQQLHKQALSKHNAEALAKLAEVQAELDQVHQSNHHHWTVLQKAQEELHNAHQANHHHWCKTQELQLQIDAIQNSWSWTLTAPLRWGGGFLLRPVASARGLANQILGWGLNTFKTPLAKVMAWVIAKNNVSKTINRWLQRWPHLHAHLVAIAHQQGILSTLPGQIVIKKKNAASVSFTAGEVQALSPDASQLTPRARQIYLKLQRPIKTNTKKKVS